MASKDYDLINMQDENDEINLQFQDFSSTNVGKGGQTVYFNDFPDSHADDGEEKLNLIGDEDETQTSSHSMWTIEYYQQWFNVNTKQVGDRILWSMIPKPGVNYLESYIRPNPDIYGPFWISVTLIFTTAIIGNLLNYSDFHGHHWRYDFHKVTIAASSIFSYTFLVPVAVWGVLLWKGSRATFSLFELICIYGYSLSIFIPVSILWIVPLPWLQWCLGIVSTVVSGTVLVRTIFSSVPHETQKIGVAVVAFLIHVVLALSFMLYFFNNSRGVQSVQSKNDPGFFHAKHLTLNKTISPSSPSQITKRDEANIISRNISTVIASVKNHNINEKKTNLLKPKIANKIINKASNSSKFGQLNRTQISNVKNTTIVTGLKNKNKIEPM